MAIYTVSQVNSYLQDLLSQDAFLNDLWVRGEVGSLSRPASGHSYFSLRDSNAALRCVMFRRSAGAHLLASGTAVVAHGGLSIYKVRGDLQLIVDIVQPEGVGELQLKMEQLKLKLEREGLFEASRKRPLPAYPQRIGVVTSPSGAVWQDIQTVTARRYPLVELLLAPAAVQGDQAAATIVEALEALDEYSDIDVVIVARGGGSLEDLWPFNEEQVARAIFRSHAPVISAVGHETDFTIADLVADHRAATPSAAAEMAVPDRIELAAKVVFWHQAMTSSVSDRLEAGRVSLGHLEPRLRRGRPDLDGLRIQIDDLLNAVARQLRQDIQLKSERTNALGMRLKSLSPRDTLGRGYAIVQTKEDSAVISDSSQVQVGDDVQVTLWRGGFDARVAFTRTDGHRS